MHRTRFALITRVPLTIENSFSSNNPNFKKSIKSIKKMFGFTYGAFIALVRVEIVDMLYSSSTAASIAKLPYIQQWFCGFLFSACFILWLFLYTFCVFARCSSWITSCYHISTAVTWSHICACNIRQESNVTSPV